MCLFFNCQACAAGENVDDTPISELDLERYLGEWFEIARFNHIFERGMMMTRANYSLRADGMIDVENSGYKDGEFKVSKGKAKLPDPVNAPAHLRVSFFGPFYSDYRVLMLDPDYQFALVSSKGPNYLWILSRTPELPEETLIQIVSEAQRRGFDTMKLIWVKQ